MRNHPAMHLATLALALAVAGLLGACAELPTATEAANPAPPEAVSPSAGAGAAVPPKAQAAAAGTSPRPGGPQASSPLLPSFATVVKDARRIEGPLTLWQKDDKVWIELLPAQFGQPFLLSPKIKSGISEAWVLGGLMAYAVNGAGGPQVVEFLRVHDQVRLQARNTEIMAKAGTPEARAVADAYSHSLLGAVPVVSQPHPERKSVLVEANGVFLSDLQGIGMKLQRGLRQGYALDRRNSVITAVRGSRRGHRHRDPEPLLHRQCRLARRAGNRQGRRGRRCRASCPTRAACWSACTIRWRRCQAADGAAPRRPALGHVHDHRARLQQRLAGLAAAALGQPLAARERRTRRPRSPSRSSPSPSGSTATCRWPTARRCARRSWNGTSRSRRSASATPSSCSSSPTTRTSTRSTSATPRCAG